MQKLSPLYISTKLAQNIGIQEGAVGVMSIATQQLGLGLILSTLLITVPPMAGMWFNGVMGSFTPYSAFNGWNSNSSQALPPNMDGGRSMMGQRSPISDTPQNTPHTEPTNQNPTFYKTASLNGSSNISAKNSDDIKRYSENESSNPNNLSNHLFQSNTNKTRITDKNRPIKGDNDEKA